jgi:xanthine dehydrogenase accessory factor
MVALVSYSLVRRRDLLDNSAHLDFFGKAAELSSRKEPFAVATIVHTQGSSSAKAGAKALIDARGTILMGWVGGGCAESVVRSEAIRCIRNEKPILITLDLQDEVLGVGMPCGGMMDVYIEPVIPKPELLIAGHGQIVRTLVKLGCLMNFSVTVNDPSADPQSFPEAERVVRRDFNLTETPITANTFVVIATLHKNDHLWLQKALEGEAAYIALIASAHRSRLVLDYLQMEGVSKERLEQVWAPAGLDLGAASPEEIALSVMSQIVAVRRGGSGESLKELKEVEQAGAPDNSAHVINQCETQGAD